MSGGEQKSGEEAERTKQTDKEMQQRWNNGSSVLMNLKKSQAEKKIMAHLLFSGGSKEEDNTTARSRLRKKKNSKKSEPKKPKNTSVTKSDFDIESIVKSIEGGSYKQPKKNNKKKKKKRKPKKNNQPSKQQASQIVVKEKSADQRRYRTISAQRGATSLTYRVREDLTIIGRTDRPGFRIPELNMQFECTSLDGTERHIFLSDIDKQYGLAYCADNCEFISCPEVYCDRLVSVVQAWRDLQSGGSPGSAAEPEHVKHKSPKEDEEEEEMSPAEAGEPTEEEDDDELVWQGFESGSSLEYPELESFVHAYESSENCLAYCFSKEADPKRYSLVYINKIDPSFYRKLHSLSKSDTIFLPCSLVDDSTTGSMPFKQIQPFIQSNPETTFVLSFPFLNDSSEAFTFFDDLVEQSDLDLSNTVLFLPYVQALKDQSKDSEMEDLDVQKDDVQTNGEEAEV